MATAVGVGGSAVTLGSIGDQALDRAQTGLRLPDHDPERIPHLVHRQARRFFEPHGLTDQKAVGQHAEGHVPVPASPAATLVVAQVQVLLAFLETGLVRPAAASQVGQIRQGSVSRSLTEIGLCGYGDDDATAAIPRDRAASGARRTRAGR